jgi:hypothetical protein
MWRHLSLGKSVLARFVFAPDSRRACYYGIMKAATRRGPAMPETPIPARQSWLLGALRAANRGLTTIQLQKSLFLLGERRKAAVGSDFYSFEAYNYGPFCRDVYDDADLLMAAGLVQLDMSSGRSLREYQLTPEGRARADQVVGELPAEAVAYLAKVVAWAQSLTFNDLIRSVYDAFPDMRKNSVFQE